MNTVIEKLTIIRRKITIRNIIYWFMILVCVINSIIFVYKVVIDTTAIKSMLQVGLPLDLALMSGIIVIMCEDRPMVTQAQIRRSDNIVTEGILLLIMIALMNIVFLFF